MEENKIIISETETNSIPKYEKKDGIAALLCIIPAYLFIRYAFLSPYSLYAMLLNLLFLGILFFYTKSHGEKYKVQHKVLFALSIIFNITFLITDKPMPKILASIFSFCLTAYTLFLVTSKREAFERSFLSAFFGSVFTIPFRGFNNAPKAISDMFRNTVKIKKLGQITVGFLLGVPLTVVVAALLVNADDGYKNMLSGIFTNINISDMVSFVFRLLCALPVAFFLFGMLYANLTNNSVSSIDKNVFRIVPPSMMYSAITPICILYALFFFTQLRYFISAFWGELPSNFSYARYARQGFFELCAITVINIVLIVIINTVCKKEEGKKHIGLNIYSGLIAFFTIVLITTAISKMVMYINEYGLSPLRVYTSWFMILLLLVFGIVIVCGLIMKRNIYKPIFAVFTLMLGILCFADIDGFIARYNIEMYENGMLEELDVDLFYELSDSVVKYTVPLADDPVYGKAIKNYLDYKYNVYKDGSDWSAWNIVYSNADKVINDYFANHTVK